ncbi:TetR/AcrR family transcriptional regulator [Solimonas sp. K1W22B-7]|uniref:QsdR family transcriptional regulator n=1 Tax=Solimonas sp. K1W22B-7 TaxID=2303331 RepID=UPI000E334B03|nr:QsdR family transcriptional regulator [Solimonas sp. K1W22B-7]AXQ27806.1 TetR/AcrR family transcriptional regulator [Solimonas sp. K1W22B-7]
MTTQAAGKRGFRRPTPDHLLALATARFKRGEFGDIEGMARELGVSRATAYLWAGNADRLCGMVICGLAERTHRESCAATRRGPGRAAQVLVRSMRAIAGSRAFRRFLEADPEKGLRIVASKNGPVQQKSIELTQALLEEEVGQGRLRLAVDAHTLAYALVRLVESFLYADLIAGEEPDLDKAETILRLLLHPGRRRTSVSRP